MTATPEPPLLDSEEGMTLLIAWARAHGAVLNGYHRKLAEKHGVAAEGVRFADAIPFHTLSKSEALAMYPPAKEASR